MSPSDKPTGFKKQEEIESNEQRIEHEREQRRIEEQLRNQQRIEREERERRERERKNRD